MTFALTNNPSQSEISEAINYLLANFGSNLVADNTTGIISGPSGVLVAYLYQYLAVKYADSFDGSVNFSNSPTNRQFYGLRNTNSSVESTDFADYIWYRAAGGFGTTKFLFYQTSGGRQVNFYVGTTAPDATYLQESGPAIDLDFLTTTTTIAYNSALPSIFQWTSSSTPPARPTTTSTYTWATGAYTAPAGWSTTQPINTTAGSYLWAITIPLVVLSTTVTSTLDWTNTSYAIYVAGSNGDTGAPGTPGAAGTAGANGLAAFTAYRIQNQSTAAPATPSNTTGPTAPSGWSLTTSSVAVGDVLWYSFGQYNSSSGTISGIPAGQTQWGTPTAASVFQDIMSDNWVSGGGSVPPTYGIPSSYSTTGYYISRNTGNVWFNNGVFRGDITGASGSFSGNISGGANINITGTGIFGGATSSGGYGSFAVIANSGYTSNGGVIGYSSFIFNAGVMGRATGTAFGGYFGSTGSQAALACSTNGGGSGNALSVDGTMAINNNTLVTNLNAQYLNGNLSSAFATVASGTNAYAANRLNGSAGLNVLRFTQGTLTGSAVAGFTGTNKPGSTSSNVWIQIDIDGTTLYLPAWT
jgi:hypothetical protein